MPGKMIFTTIATVVIATSALSATAFARGGAGHAGRIARGPAGERVAHHLGRHFHRRDGFYDYFDGGLGDCSWPEYAQSNPWYCSAY